MYSLGALCVLAAYLAFYQIYKENRLFDWCVFGFTSLCAAYIHYYALLSVAFFYLMLLPLWFKGKEFRKRILYLYGGTVLAISSGSFCPCATASSEPQRTGG